MTGIDQAQYIDPRWFKLLLEREMQSCLGGFIQGLIHNVNGPLQNISMLAELIQTGLARLDSMPGGGGKQHADEGTRILEREKQRLQKLSEQVALLDNILRELRSLHEIESNPGEIDLNFLVVNLAAAFRCDLFFKHHVHLELKLASDLPRIRVPARDLIPPLIHLFRNASTALREAPQKHLVIESRTDEKMIWLSLRDTGCGLTSGEEARCFEAFYSGWPPSIQKQETHHGIGLFLAAAFLEPYGIRVRLTTDGAETVASLEIPAKPDEVLKS